MNKKMLVIPVFLLAFAFISIPVMGAPATKIEGVTIEVFTTGQPVPDDGYPRWVSDGTIVHSKGESSPGSTVTLFIPGVGTYVDGDWHTDWIFNGNWKKGEFVIPSKNTMTFAEGTFEGVNQRRITGESPFSPTAYFEDRSVWKGVSGIFKGWTLKLSYEGTPSTITEGYIIIPK